VYTTRRIRKEQLPLDISLQARGMNNFAAAGVYVLTKRCPNSDLKHVDYAQILKPPCEGIIDAAAKLHAVWITLLPVDLRIKTPTDIGMIPEQAKVIKTSIATKREVPRQTTITLSKVY
jgi:hypothetical protein